eukprot:6487697-Alexandrium_andersonii.AAC.1
MSASLVGSEMCIRDRSWQCDGVLPHPGCAMWVVRAVCGCVTQAAHSLHCLLYTSDAADDM